MTHEQHIENRDRNIAKEQLSAEQWACAHPEAVLLIQTDDRFVRDATVPFGMGKDGNGFEVITGVVFDRVYARGRLCDLLAAGLQYRMGRARITADNCPSVARMGEPKNLETVAEKYQPRKA